MSTGNVTRTARETAGFVGSLADTPLAEVFRRIVREERSGDLQVTTPDAIKTVYFDRGFVVFASSDLQSDRLGESLIEAGRISRQEFAAASMMMKTTKQKFGRVLVQSGIVSEEELGQLVAAQVNRIVLSLFSAKRGMYSFDERATTIPIELMVSLSVYRILMDGIRRMTSKKLVLTGLPPLATEVKVVDRPPFTFDVRKLTRMEKEVLRVASDGASLERIAEIIGGNEGVPLRACYGLVAAGVLGFTSSAAARRRPPTVQEETGTFLLSEIRRKVGVSPPAEPSPPTSAALPDSLPPRPSAASPGPPPRTPAPLVVEHDEPAAPSIGPGWLSRLWSALTRWWRSSPEAPAPAPKSEPASVRPATTPPANRAPSPSAASPGRVEEQGPHPTPQEPQRRVEKLGTPSWSMKDPEPERDATSAIAGEPGWNAPDWSVAADASAQFQDFYEELGVATQDASPPSPKPEVEAEAGETAEVSTAFSSDADWIVESENGSESGGDVASMLHQIPVEAVAPVEESVELEIEVELEDGLFATPDIAPDERAVPEETTGASPAPSGFDEALSQRPSGLRESPAPPPSDPGESRPSESAPVPRAEVEAETGTSADADRAEAARDRAMLRMKAGGGEQRLLRDVKLHFKLRDWEGAVPLLEQLVSISPGSALYRGMLARALSRHPVRRKDAEEHFVEALRMAPQDPEIHYWLGLYYKSFGLQSRAATEFRTTLRIKPEHKGARTQLGVGNRKDDALGAVIKKIFG